MVPVHEKHACKDLEVTVMGREELVYRPASAN